MCLILSSTTRRTLTSFLVQFQFLKSKAKIIQGKTSMQTLIFSVTLMKSDFNISLCINSDVIGNCQLILYRITFNTCTALKTYIILFSFVSVFIICFSKNPGFNFNSKISYSIIYPCFIANGRQIHQKHVYMYMFQIFLASFRTPLFPLPSLVPRPNNGCKLQLPKTWN